MVHWIAIFDPERGSRSTFCGSVSDLDTILKCLDRIGLFWGNFDPLLSQLSTWFKLLTLDQQENTTQKYDMLHEMPVYHVINKLILWLKVMMTL